MIAYDSIKRAQTRFHARLFMCKLWSNRIFIIEKQMSLLWQTISISFNWLDLKLCLQHTGITKKVTVKSRFWMLWSKWLLVGKFLPTIRAPRSDNEFRKSGDFLITARAERFLHEKRLVGRLRIIPFVFWLRIIFCYPSNMLFCSL